MKHSGYFKSERGAMSIVEATFVFPIMFFIVFFLIMAGEAYYQRARVEQAVTCAAVYGAARCENPMLESVVESVASSGKVPKDPAEIDVMPYRYILTGEAKSIASQVKSDLESEIEAMEPLFFHNMKPNLESVSINVKMNPLISSFPVTVKFSVPFPIRIIFSTDPIEFHYEINITTSIGDPSELVRNVAIVMDLMERSKTATNITSKISEMIDPIWEWVN